MNALRGESLLGQNKSVLNDNQKWRAKRYDILENLHWTYFYLFSFELKRCAIMVYICRRTARLYMWVKIMIKWWWNSKIGMHVHIGVKRVCTPHRKEKANQSVGTRVDPFCSSHKKYTFFIGILENSFM